MSPDPIYDGLKEGLSIYGYCRNNPLKYIDPNGLEAATNDDYNGDNWGKSGSTNNKGNWTYVGEGKGEKFVPPKYKANSQKTETIDYIKQKHGKTVKYPKACQAFGIVDAGIKKGMTPYKQGEELEVAVNEMVLSGTDIIDIIRIVFAADIGDKTVYYAHIPVGLDAEGINEIAGTRERIGLLVYEQSDFWGSKKLTGLHGIGFYDMTFIDPYFGKEGTFEQIRGSKAAEVDQYLKSPGTRGKESFIFFWK